MPAQCFIGAISPNLGFKEHLMSCGGGLADSSADVHRPSHEYFYALPQDFDESWHVVHQQRLDSDADAASRVREAILAEFTSIPPDAVEVAAIDVDMFNNAFRFVIDHKDQQICRSKKFEGQQWRLENKRFLVRVRSADSSHILQRLSSKDSGIPLHVQNVPQLATQLVTHQNNQTNLYYQKQTPYGKDFEYYETHSQPMKRVPADAANSGNIILSLCSPFVFAVQGSLAHAPSSAIDLSVLGTAFLDIIKVIVAQPGLLLASTHASSYRSFFPAFAARYMERAHHRHQLLLPQFHAVSHAKLLRPLP